MRTRHFLLFFPVILAVALLMGCSAPNQAATPDAGGGRGGRGGRGDAGGGSVPVVTAQVVTKPIPVVIDAVGTAEAFSTVQVRAQVTGQLSAIHFAEGQEVRKGQTLFSLDQRPFQTALEQAQAVLAKDTAQAKNAESQATRYSDLFARGLIPRDQYETQAATAVSLQATLAADEGAVQQARLSLQYATITAPLDGRTGALMVHQGDLIRANDTNPLVVINQLAPIRVVFSVPGRFLADVRRYQGQKPLSVEARTPTALLPGQQAPATLPSTTAAPPSAASPVLSTGTVSFIDNTVDPSTGTIKLKGTFANTDHRLWPGLFVQVKLLLSTQSGAIVVPSAAIQSGQTGQGVYVVKPDQTVEYRQITVQRQQGDDVVITNGLKPGETVVTDGQLRLTPGSRVTTRAPEAPQGTSDKGRGARPKTTP